jgi:LmbE family N-acetylglucosaminyl deacetylase
VFSIARESVPLEFPQDILQYEVQDAGAILGIPRENIRVMDYPVRRFPQYRQEILEDLVKLRSEIKPQLILVHASTDIHQDHNTVHNEAVRAFKRETILGYQVPWNNLKFNPQLVVALEQEHLDTKLNAIFAYKSQIHRPYSSSEFVVSWARTNGILIGSPYAETFEVIHWVF